MLRKLAWPAALVLLSGCLSARQALLDLDARKDEEDVQARLDKLAELRANGARKLDLVERCRAIALGVERVDCDPSRIVRAKALDTIARLLPSLGPRASFAILPVDEAELTTAIEPLLTLSTAGESKRDELRSQTAALQSAARALAQARPEKLSLANKLLFLATRTARIAVDEACVRELETASRDLSRHAAFLAGRKALTDPVLDVRIAAARLLVGADPVAATVELGRWHFKGARTADEAALEEVALLQALADSGLPAVAVHPSLRPALVKDLDFDNAAVTAWARVCLARLLGIDPEKADEKDLRARWLALGDWDAAVPHT